jgi:glycosyltransferase involved in cell wall biosynthesis
MPIRIVFISEVINFPYDEGVKNVVFNLIGELRKRAELRAITKKGNNPQDLLVDPVDLNKLFFNLQLMTLLRQYSPDFILYAPYASCTFNSFLRAKVLKIMSGKTKLGMLALQHREYSFINRWLLGLVRPDVLFITDSSDKEFFQRGGFNIKVLPPAVDNSRFLVVNHDKKLSLRQKYGLPLDKKIILHVGHIKENRGIRCLIEIHKSSQDVQVVLVGSTSTEVDQRLKEHFETHGVIILNQYISSIQEIYQLADLYVFPVQDRENAIDLPLSILEAMACGVPVLTTKFGGLKNYFHEDAGLRYFDNIQELLGLVNSGEMNGKDNPRKVEMFTWANFVNEMMNSIEALNA